MATARRRLPSPSGATPGVDGFNFTDHMRALCADLCGRLDELAHVDLSRVAIRFCQTRNHSRYGVYASLTPLRFAGGMRTTRRRGRTWTIERLYNDAGREMLYLLSFYLPRFLDRSFDYKLSTVVHELLHIGPAFDGDLPNVGLEPHRLFERCRPEGKRRWRRCRSCSRRSPSRSRSPRTT